jgi:lauroyl/myristoyl acyltransferase
LIEIMERFIKAHPEQWVMFSPIWKDDISNSHKDDLSSSHR